MIDGLPADVVTLALANDIDAIATKTGKIPADWQKRLPNNSAPYTSTIVLLVRKGNPKGVRNWDDLAKPGVAVVTPNPKTGGGRTLELPRRWAYGLKAFKGDEAKTKAFVKAIYDNAPVLDTGRARLDRDLRSARDRRRADNLGERGVSRLAGIWRG